MRARETGGDGHRAAAVTRSVTVEVAADSTIWAHNDRGVVMPIGTGWQSDTFNPIELLLVALGGCAAIDFTKVLEKRGYPLTGLAIEVVGQRASDERFEGLQVRYLLPPDVNVSDEDIEVARRLTADVLCTVSRTIVQSCPVEHVVLRSFVEPNLGTATTTTKDTTR